MSQYSEAAAYSNTQRIEQLESRLGQLENEIQQMKTCRATTLDNLRITNITDILNRALVGKWYRVDNELFQIQSVTQNSSHSVTIHFGDYSLTKSLNDSFEIFDEI